MLVEVPLPSFLFRDALRINNALNRPEEGVGIFSAFLALSKGFEFLLKVALNVLVLLGDTKLEKEQSVILQLNCLFEVLRQNQLHYLLPLHGLQTLQTNQFLPVLLTQEDTEDFHQAVVDVPRLQLLHQSAIIICLTDFSIACQELHQKLPHFQ